MGWRNEPLDKKLKEWTNEALITEEVAIKIQKYEARKPENKKDGNILPVLAGVLISLGILSFVASNWMTYSHLMKLFILLFVLIGSYSFSDYLQKKQLKSLSVGARFIGLITFGASIILIGQMFHVQAYDTFLFVIWGLIAFGFFLYERHVVFFISAMLLFSYGMMFYGLSQGAMQYLLLIVALVVATSFFYVYKEKRTSGEIYFAYLYVVVSFYIQTANWFPDTLSIVWPLFIGMIFYGSSIWIRWKESNSLKNVALFVGFLSLYYFSIIGKWTYDNAYFTLAPLAKNVVAITFGFIVISVLYKGYQRKEWSRLYHLLLFVPILLIPAPYIGFTSLALLLLFSVIYIIIAIQKHRRKAYQTGVIAFALCALSVYFQLTYSFMSKSIFFIVSGIVLIITYVITRKIGKGWDHEA
ncbi:MAG: DUF2157 domain-containing protein [Bacillaceae bacterium]